MIIIYNNDLKTIITQPYNYLNIIITQPVFVDHPKLILRLTQHKYGQYLPYKDRSLYSNQLKQKPQTHTVYLSNQVVRKSQL